MEVIKNEIKEETKFSVENYKSIQPEGKDTIKDANQFWINEFAINDKNTKSNYEIIGFDNKDYHEFEKYKKEHLGEFASTFEDRNNYAKNGDGEWTGDIGNSKFIPSDEKAKKELEDRGIDGVDYVDGNPDFSKCSEATVEIDSMTSNRYNNFAQADAKCAEKWNSEKKDERTDWTARDVKAWRQENRFSWHERVDMKTMDLVQRDVHDECKHWGGVAECKRYEAAYAFEKGDKK